MPVVAAVNGHAKVQSDHALLADQLWRSLAAGSPAPRAS